MFKVIVGTACLLFIIIALCSCAVACLSIV